MKKGICYSDLILLTGDIERNIEQLISFGADKVELLREGKEFILEKLSRSGGI